MNYSQLHPTPFARLSTGLKMLIALGLALLPLGLIALFSSLDTASEARATRADASELIAETSARSLSAAFDRIAISLRTAATAVAIDRSEPDQCSETLQSLVGLETEEMHFAIAMTDGEIVCATPGFVYRYTPAVLDGGFVGMSLDPKMKAMTLVVSGANRRLIGIAELPDTTLSALAAPLEPVGNFEMRLAQGALQLPIRDWQPASVPATPRRFEHTLANSRVRLLTALPDTPLRLAEILTIALPVAMLLTAALVGWLVVDRMLLRPILQLQRAVARYGGEGGAFALPPTRTPALEIQELGRAFETAFAQLQDKERELQAGLAEQVRLTRDVHHRVKNNLQVVSSLLSLHARAAKTGDATEAYASIRRRVDALAVVQRNILADSEAGSAIPIRPVIAEIASGLSQPGFHGQELAIGLDIANLRVAQDHAVPIAFLLTELAELAMQCSDKVELSIALTAKADDSLATLEIRSEALSASPDCTDAERYERVITGLTRQLRSPLDKNEAGTSYCIEIPVVDIATAPPA